MSNYTKLTDFATKDALVSGNPSKIVKGTELDDEFNELETHISSKVDSASGSFSGTPTTPTATTGTNTTQIASTAFVQQEIEVALPVGSLVLMAFTSPTPSGYLVADGSVVSRAGYPDLFSAVGTVFGSGDGSTTFNLPNISSDAGTQYFIKF